MRQRRDFIDKSEKELAAREKMYTHAIGSLAPSSYRYLRDRNSVFLFHNHAYNLWKKASAVPFISVSKSRLVKINEKYELENRITSRYLSTRKRTIRLTLPHQPERKKIQKKGYGR